MHAMRRNVTGLLRGHWRRLMGVGVAALGIVAVQRSGAIESAIGYVGALGAWAPVAFALLHAASVVAFVPSVVPNFAAGALFGGLAGFPLSLVGAGLGAVAALTVGRALARDFVALRFGRDPRFLAVDRLVRERGARIVALARLSPVVPFAFANYAFGATPIRGRDYFAASVLGTMPSNAVYVYLGALAGEVSASQTEGRARTPMEWALLGLGLVATVALMVYLRRHVAGMLATSEDGAESRDR